VGILSKQAATAWSSVWAEKAGSKAGKALGNLAPAELHHRRQICIAWWHHWCCSSVQPLLATRLAMGL